MTTNVQNYHVRQFVEVGLVTARASELKGTAVHVHFPVPDSVEPGPANDTFAGRDIGWDAEFVGSCATTIGILWKISSLSLGRAAAFDRVDYLPLGILGGRVIVGQDDLARAATMDS